MKERPAPPPALRRGEPGPAVNGRSALERLLLQESRRLGDDAQDRPDYFAQRNPKYAAVLARERREAAALSELYGRGLDAKRPRRFRGRVDLTVQCKPKGHELANVYPTRSGPVFVPTVAEAPLRRDSLPPGSAERRRLQEESAALRRLGIPMGTAVSGPINQARDAWVEIGDEPRAYIRGAGLADVERWQWSAHEDFGHHLLCRCGTRAVWLYEIAAALTAGTRRLFV